MNKFITNILIIIAILNAQNASAAGGMALAPCLNPSNIPFSEPADQTAGVSSPALTVSLGCTTTQTFTVTAYSDAACSSVLVGAISNVTKAGSTAAGVVTWTNFTYVTATTMYLKITATNFNASACRGPIVISPGAAATLDFSTQPSATGTINTTFSTPPVVKLYDAYNNFVSSDSSTSVTLSAFTDSSCTVAASGTVINPSATASSGNATFTNVKYSKSYETTYFKASSGALTTDCSSSFSLNRPDGPGTIPPCGGLSAHYTVDTSSSSNANGSACSNNKYLINDLINGITVPKCIEADCGANSGVCSELTDSGNTQNHHCYYCNNASCLN